ncbi:MAG: hypothetical protein ACM3TN_16905 [Alphaproteobacteria bacterium]
MQRLLGALIVSLLLATVAMAAGPKDYQVTGPVLDVNNDVITVQKGTEKWEIGRDKNTKVDGDLKKSSRVTIKYKMTASSIEVKDVAKAAAKSKSDTKGKVEEKKTK